jgi:hypothetical protein
MRPQNALHLGKFLVWEQEKALYAKLVKNGK